jgi:DNA-binding transcriptional LysR family regulator
MREEGSATRQVAERALQPTGPRCEAAMELHHPEAIKQAVMAGLGIARVSIHAVRGQLASRRLAALRVRGLHLRRHFHVIHDEELYKRLPSRPTSTPGARYAAPCPCVRLRS